jgi:hypothetical protein
MNISDYKIKLADEIIKDREYVNNKFLALEVDNIKQLRNLVIQFIIISSAIVGFSLPILDNGHLVQNKNFLISGLIELLIVVLYGFFYLSKILQKENNDLKFHHDAHSIFLTKRRDATIEFMKNMNDVGNFDRYEAAQKDALKGLEGKVKKPLEKKDFALDIIFSAFFIGLILIVLSLVDFKILSKI